MKLTIGSGDVKDLLSKNNTKAYQSLMQKFVSSDIQIYNAFASPIDALRTGAILEERYLQILPDNYFAQYKVISKEMDCMRSTLDFALIEKGKLKTFEELKTIFFTDFIEHIEPLKNMDYKNVLEVIKKKFKSYYNQIQQQLYVSELSEAQLVFLTVTSYDDDVNYLREIKENDYFKIEIKRDEKVIDLIKQKAQIFQLIRNNILNNE